MSDIDSPTDSPGDASPEQTAGQTSASDQAPAPAQPEPSQPPPSSTDGEGKSSYEDRIRGLMSSLGRKENEKQEALRDRDEAQAALTALQATYEGHDQRQSQAAPAQTPAGNTFPTEPSAPVAPTESPAPEPTPVFAPTSPSRAFTAVSGQPRMSEADRALEQLQQSFDNHMRLLNNRH